MEITFQQIGFTEPTIFQMPPYPFGTGASTSVNPVMEIDTIIGSNQGVTVRISASAVGPEN